MVSSFVSGFVAGAEPAFRRVREAQDNRQMDTLLLQSQETYVAERDRLLNLAGDEDWAPEKLDQQLDVLLQRSLDVPELDEWRRQRLTNNLNNRNRAGKNGYRKSYEGKVEAVQDAEYVLQLTRGFNAIDQEARTGGGGGDFMGAYALAPFSTTPQELMDRHSDYLAGTLEELNADKSLEAQEKLAKRQLAAEKAIKGIHKSYQADYNKHHNARLDAVIAERVGQTASGVEDAIRDAFRQLDMGAGSATQGLESIVAALDYENISQLAEMRGKAYTDVVSEGDLQKVLGSMLAMRFLGEHTPAEADTDSTSWRAWVQELENSQNDEALSSVFSNILGADTAEFVKTNTAAIVSAARADVNRQRPTEAIRRQNYELFQKNADARITALAEDLSETSLFDEQANLFRATIDAAFDPDVGDDGSGNVPWLDVLGSQMSSLAAKEAFGHLTEFGDQNLKNPKAAENYNKISKYLGDRIATTLNVMNQPGYATENLATLDEEQRDIILRDVVQKTAPEFNNVDNYFVQGGQMSGTAKEAFTRFAQARGFIPPAYIDFVQREIDNYEQQVRAGQYRGSTQETADKAQLQPVTKHVSSILNSKVFAVLPLSQRKGLNDLMDKLLAIRNPGSSEAPRPANQGAE